jgi:exodeoxyribonuclease V beta subunit
MAALAEMVMLSERVPGRMLAWSGGERRLTDLQHVASLLHAAASGEQLGPAALTAWLRQRIAAAAREGGNEELTRRLESDAEAVQVLTIHRSKGLEFPIVYCPFLWEPGWIPEGKRPVYFHDSGAGDTRAIDVGLEGSDYYAHANQYVREERGEDLRLAYVALTRAKHQAIVWWAGSKDSRDSPLGRLLFARDEDGTVEWKGRFVPTDAAAFERLEAVRAKAPAAVSVEWSRLGTPAVWAGAPKPVGELAVARFDRRLDLLWRRTSYTAITAGAHEARVGSEPEEEIVTDEPSEPVAGSGPGAVDGIRDVGTTADGPGALLPLGTMAVGAQVGTVIHRALERVDFAAADLPAALGDVLRGASGRGGADLGCDVEVAAAGVALALQTPLGGGLGELALCDLAPHDRLDELTFELPLAGGETPHGRADLHAIAAARREWLPAGDPLAGYADRLEDPSLSGRLRGYLTGSIDLVLRVGSGRPGFAIVDYKTNWLAGPGEPLTAWHYRPVALREEMLRSHYGLQALLYTVALHRYLRWRLPGYDPESQLLGVHYLFLRGMLGPGTPVVDGERSGVFHWRPPGGLVAALSDVLDGRS